MTPYQLHHPNLLRKWKRLEGATECIKAHANSVLPHPPRPNRIKVSSIHPPCNQDKILLETSLTGLNASRPKSRSKVRVPVGGATRNRCRVETNSNAPGKCQKPVGISSSRFWDGVWLRPCAKPAVNF